MNKKSLLIAIITGCVVFLFAAGAYIDRRTGTDSILSNQDSLPYIEVSMEEQSVSLVGGVVQEWIKWEDSAKELYDKYREHGRIYTAKTVLINWSVFDIPEGVFVKKQCFELSTENSFATVERYDLDGGKRSIELHNLLVDTEYFFRITIEFENNISCTTEGNFKTKWSPRIIEFENLRNVRDIGGWKTADGKTIKQGLLYRGCELDGATETKYQITQAGVHTFLNDFGIKTELDLRAPNLPGAKDMLGKEVKHEFFSFLSYTECFSEYGSNKLREVFKALAIEENYPIYLHCTYGADRTGTVCYILEALLGVSEKDCYREWELSILTNGGAFYEEMDDFVDELCKMEGDNLQEKTENYLLSIGVTKSEIENIRKILIEDYAVEPQK